MKLTTIAALTAAIATPVHAAPTIQIVHDNTSAFLVANNLQKATISLTGFNNGESIQGLIGTSANPWTVTVTVEPGYFNMAPFGSVWSNSALDCGLLPSDQNSPFGVPMGGIGGFGAGDGNEVLTSATWLNANPRGFAVNATSVLPVLRVTWPRNASVTVGLVVVMNTPAAQIPLTVTIPQPLNPCPWDLNRDAQVNLADLLDLIAQWGTDGPADLKNDGTVNVADLLALIGHWGRC